MADSLSELAAQANAANKPAFSPKPQQPAARGDDLIARANQAADLTPEQKRYANLFVQSKEILEQRINEDSAFGQSVLPKMEKMYGEQLSNFVIDEADKIKIDYLKRNDPRFNADEAASAAFVNDLSFGQGLRVLRGAAEATDKLSNVTGGAISRKSSDIPIDEFIEQKREEFRLLEKAFPKANVMGRVGAFITPASPLRAVFNAGSKGLSAIAGPLINRIVKNPGLLNTSLQAGAALSGGEVATTAIRSTLGDDGDFVSLDRGAKTAAKAGALAFITGAAIPVAGRIIEKGAEGAAPYVQSAVSRVQESVEGAVERATGVNPSALRAYNQWGGKYQVSYGREKEIGDDLVEFLQSAKNSAQPEAVAARKLLPEMPDVDGRGLLNALRSVKSPNPGQKEAAGKLQEWAKWAEDRIVGSGASAEKVPAKLMREIVDDLQDFARDAYGRESNLLLSEIKSASRVGRLSIEDAALKVGGENGKLYVDLMGKAAEKQGLLKFVSKQLGRHPEAMEKNSERFIQRLFGPNKEIVVNRMKALDQKFGTNFVEQAQDTLIARQIGPGGVPAWTPQYRTGASLYGVVTGNSIGGRSGAITGAVLSSPKVGAQVIGMSDNVSGVAKAMFGDPQALSRLASMGAQPIEIRKFAQEIQKALIKDGPQSAAGVLRIAADTPYFVGLVSAFDAVQTQMRKGVAQGTLQKMSEVATPDSGAPQY